MRVFSLATCLVIVLSLAASAPCAAEDDEPALPWQTPVELGPWKPIPASTLHEEIGSDRQLMSVAPRASGRDRRPGRICLALADFASQP